MLIIIEVSILSRCSRYIFSKSGEKPAVFILFSFRLTGLNRGIARRAMRKRRAGESCHRMIGGRFLSKRLQHGENPAIIESVFPLRIWQPHRLKEITHARQKSIHRHSGPRPEAQAAPADAPQLHHRRAGRRADCPRRQPRALLHAQPLHRRIFAPLLCASGCDRFPRRRGVLRRRIHPLRRRNGHGALVVSGRGRARRSACRTST